MVALLSWWLVASALGWLCWPLVAQTLRASPARGFAYARALSLLLVTYFFWIASTLWRYPNNALALWAMAALVILLSALAWVRHHQELKQVLQEEYRHIITVELLYLGSLVLYAAQRSYYPAIIHTEQPMDFAFLNSALRSAHMPPRDPWFSGAPISYYYLGYLLAAVLSRLSGTTAGMGYTLALAHTFALTMICAYGLIHDLIRTQGGIARLERRARGYGLVGAVAIALASNLEGVLEAIKALGWGSAKFFAWFRVPGLAEAPTVRALVPQGPWWWWRASRLIVDERLWGSGSAVITEFPAFSFLLGDLHPHLMAIPYVLVGLGLVLELYHIGMDAKRLERGPLLALWPIPIALGALAMINAWDFPAILVLCLLALALGRTRQDPAAATSRGRMALLGGGLALASVALYLPYYAVLQTPLGGIGLAYWAKTPLRHFLLIFGLWLMPIVTELLVSRRAGRDRAWQPRSRGAFWLAWGLLLLAPWGLTFLLGGWGRVVLGLVRVATVGPWLLLLQSALLAALLVDLGDMLRSRAGQPDSAQTLLRLATFMGVGLTYLVEFVYLRDAFDSRMNTVFKAYYQAWLLLGVSAFVAAFRLWRMEGWPRLVYSLSGILLLICLYYPLATAYTRTAGYTGSAELDGTAYWQREAPAEYGALQWLQEHAQASDVVVEAPGEEYQVTTSRLSGWTGVPTIIGWPGHEAQWRGSLAEIRRRSTDVDRIYLLPDRQQVLALLQAYDATYLYVGSIERERYDIDAQKLAWFASFLTTRYAQGDTRLYAVPLAP